MVYNRSWLVLAGCCKTAGRRCRDLHKRSERMTRQGAGLSSWNDTMQADELIPLVRGMQDTTDLEAVVWDGAPSHRDARLSRLDLPLIALPPYAPELNPAERVFEEIRGEIEGEVYATLEDKVAAVEAILRALDADPARVQRLTGWAWIHAAFDRLPASPLPNSIAA